MDGVTRANRFVEGVLSGLDVPQTVRDACKRHKKDLERKDLWFDEKSANIAIRTIEKLKHAKGRWQGKPIVLEDWQCFFVCSLFGWKKGDKRRFRYAYLQLPRKNGKTLLAICIALLMFGPDMEPGAEVYLGATSQDQAKDLLFLPAKFIVNACKKFKERFGVEVNASNLVIPANFSVFKSVIKKPDDGTNPHWRWIVTGKQ